MQNISDFVDRLIEEKGFSEKDPEVLAQLKSDLQDRLEDRINAMILSNMPGEGLEEFEEALDSDNEEKISACVKKYIPTIDEKVAMELLTFKSMYLS